MQDLKPKVEQVIKNTLPDGFYRSVTIGKTFYGTEMLRIIVAASDQHINDVQGQQPQMVSFRLDSDLSLEPQHYGGCGGRSIELIPEPNSYFAIERVHIPFRKPKKTEDAVLRALQRFFTRYLAALKENKKRLHSAKYADYETLLAD